MRCLYILFLLNSGFALCQNHRSDSIVFVDFQFLESVTISSGYHYAFPDICKTADDSLLILYRIGSGHSGIDGKIVKQKGSADGLHWTTVTTAIDDMATDDRDPSVFRLPDGTIMSIYYKWLPGNLYAYPPSPPMYKLYYVLSFDNGITFTQPIALDTTMLQLPAGYSYANYTYYDTQGLPIKNFAGSSHAINSYGKLMYPSYGGNLMATTSNSPPFCFASDKYRLYIHESDDYGLSWTYRVINENVYPDIWLSEPSICDLGNGKLIMHIRSSTDTCNPSGIGPLLQSYSYDAGDTWTTPQSLQLNAAQAPYLYKTSKGILISAFRLIPNYQFSFQNTSFIYSIDDGITWSQPILVENCIAECGYPGIIELDTHKVMIVYYAEVGNGIKGVIYEMTIEYSGQTLGNNNIDFNENNITVYPNPTQGEINVEYNFSRDKEVNINLYNSIGMVVFKESYAVQPGGYKKYYDFSDLTAGIYYLSIENQGKEIRKKLVINR